MRTRQPAVIPLLLALSPLGCARVPASGSAAVETTPGASVELGSDAPSPRLSIGGIFESARYGYRLALPADWTGTETPGTGGVHPDEPGVDTFKDRTGHILSIVGEPAVSGLSAWTCATNLHLRGEHKLAVEASEEMSIRGEPARLSEYHLTIRPYVIHYLTIEVAHAARGLTLSLESTTGADEDDRALLDELTRSFTFTT